MPRAYYNENEPFAAEWLRNLIAAGHIMAGDVDERSIVDVRAEDLRGYTRVHLFSGIAGWERALQLAGWPEDRECWSGSCPCQPFSVAGKGGGADDPRHLWPHMRRLLGQCRPATVFGEQVASRAGREWLAGVFADLEALGYRRAGADLCAAGCGAPHIRQRLWWVAQSGRDVLRSCEPRADERRLQEADGRDTQRLADPERDGRGPDEPGRGPEGRGAAWRAGASGGLADAEDPDRGREPCGARQAEQRRRGPAGGGDDGRVAHTEGNLRGARGDAGEGTPDGAGCDHWGNTWLHCSDGTARRVEPGIPPLAHGVPRAVGDLCAGGGELGDDPAALLKDARRFRKGALKCAGNAIVPQVAAEFVKAYMDA